MTRHILHVTATVSFLLALPAVSRAQFTGSGSTGAAGAYSPTVSGVFPAATLAALEQDTLGDNIFQFTTINIPVGVTITLPASAVGNAPVVWLASGTVTIAGTISLAGDSGYTLNAASTQQIIETRREAQPGAGGYYGGLGSNGGVGPESGAGPGGGPAGLNSSTGYQCYGGSGASFAAGISSAYVSGTGTPYGNAYLVPMYGGSGGGGGWGSNAINAVGGGGGAGGGAIRIVSSSLILLNGSILANGGNGGAVTSANGSCPGGPGGGGSVNLIAPTITGTGTINVQSGYSLYGVGSPNFMSTNDSNGIVRFNVTNYNGGISVPGGGYSGGVSSGDFIVGPLYNVPSNSTVGQPTLTITSVNSINVPQPPNGLYLMPDVTISANSPVTVAIAATNVPLGTTPILRLTAETAGDTTITCNPLTGTLANSTGTCSATFPFSISIAELRATF